MRQKVYIIYDEQTEYVADRICKKNGIDKKFFSTNSELTADILKEMTNLCIGQFFYIIKTDKEILFPDFDFTYKPETWDKDYVHMWGNNTVRLYNTDNVLKNPAEYTDEALKNGDIKLKNNIDKIYTYPTFDIIFLSYDEEYADANYEKLKERFPRAKRLHNIKGIFEAHKSAAQWAEHDKSDMFYVVDADAEIVSTFDFSYQPHSLNRQSVHVWHSRNPINDLEYGYGGIKLFPTKLLVAYEGSPIDFTTTVSKSFKVMDEVSNITKFNTDPFSAWRSGFRECAKLASKIIPKQDNAETELRLSVWCSKGEDRSFGDFTIMGAIDGANFGRAHKDQPDMLGLINDFSWLEKRFNS
jgi:hypothetical protein